MTGPKGIVVTVAVAALLLALAPLGMAHDTGADQRRAGLNNGVSGEYVGSGTAGAVECLNSTAAPGAPCMSLLFAPTGWGAAGGAFCDFEYVNADQTDETVVDNLPSINGGLVPDGTIDDGGQGGACHVSNYVHPGGDNLVDTTGNANWYNTNPNHAGEATTNSADSVCTGTAYASDLVWGADVPILAGCHYADFTNDGGQSFASCAVNAVVASSPPEAKPGALVACLTIAPSVGGSSWTCMAHNATSGGSVNLVNLGKGGGTSSAANAGVSVPNATALGVNPCPLNAGRTAGDVVVFVNALVSANPFCHEFTDEAPNGQDQAFGWKVLCPGATAGDTIVYLPLSGWIDHVY